MQLSQTYLASIGRVGMGVTFLVSMLLDVKSKSEIFALMEKKHVRMPLLCFIGADTWKVVTALALIFNFYTQIAALLLALYIFLANLVFNNFWAAPEKQRNFSSAMFLIHLATCFGLISIAAT